MTRATKALRRTRRQRQGAQRRSQQRQQGTISTYFFDSRFHAADFLIERVGKGCIGCAIDALTKQPAMIKNPEARADVLAILQLQQDLAELENEDDYVC